jgi:hypothetical protein
MTLAAAALLAAVALLGWSTSEGKLLCDVHAQPSKREATHSVGDASFKAADRLAIVNLVGAYCQACDAAKLDDVISLFTDKVDFKYVYRDKTRFESLAAISRVLKERREFYERNKWQRRHVTSSYVFTNQSDREAEGRVNIHVFLSRDGGGPAPLCSGVYEFTAVRQGSVWKFSRFLCRQDQFDSGI